MKRRHRKPLGASSSHHDQAAFNADRRYQSVKQEYKEAFTCKEVFAAFVKMAERAEEQTVHVDSMDQHPVAVRAAAEKRAARASSEVHDAETFLRKNCVLSKNVGRARR